MGKLELFFPGECEFSFSSGIQGEEKLSNFAEKTDMIFFNGDYQSLVGLFITIIVGPYETLQLIIEIVLP